MYIRIHMFNCSFEERHMYENASFTREDMDTISPEKR